jgi:hypothetical protein
MNNTVDLPPQSDFLNDQDQSQSQQQNDTTGSN